jgi:NTP pyrophosphatase (non-canonical NTP hydrolase)
VKPFNELTPAEVERLALLAEECGECIQAIGKVLRHGYESQHPEGIHHGATNRTRLTEEMGDVRAAMIMLCDAGDIVKVEVHAAADDKLKRVRPYLHHQRSQSDALYVAPGKYHALLCVRRRAVHLLGDCVGTVVMADNSKSCQMHKCTKCAQLYQGITASVAKRCQCGGALRVVLKLPQKQPARTERK